MEAIGDMVEEAEVIMNTLNGLLRDWESFIRGICARRKLAKFSRLWEECVQEEGRIANKEEKLNDDQDQALEAHAKKGKNKRKDRDQSPRRTQRFQRNTSPKRDLSSFECFNCHKMGHISRNCPLKEEQFRKRNKKFHAHVVEDDDPVEEKTMKLKTLVKNMS